MRNANGAILPAVQKLDEMEGEGLKFLRNGLEEVGKKRSL